VKVINTYCGTDERRFIPETNLYLDQYLRYTGNMKFTRLSERVRHRIVDCFIADIPASQAAEIIGTNRKTINTWYAELRSRLVVVAAQLPPPKSGRVFMGYHERRIAKFNGLRGTVKRYHLMESRVRDAYRKDLRPLVLSLASDLLN